MERDRMTDSNNRTLAHPGAHTSPPHTHTHTCKPRQGAQRVIPLDLAMETAQHGSSMERLEPLCKAGCGGQHIPKSEHSHSLLHRNFVPRCCLPRVCRYQTAGVYQTVGARMFPAALSGNRQVEGKERTGLCFQANSGPMPCLELSRVLLSGGIHVCVRVLSNSTTAESTEAARPTRSG